MRILMLTQFYPPIIGGEERHVRDLSIELTKRGHDVTVATLWKEGMPEFDCEQGVRIYRIRGSMQRMSILFTEKEHRNLPPFPDPEVLWALRGIIAQEHPDIIHAHNWMVHSFTPLKTWSKAKLIVTLHDTSLICAQKRFSYHEKLCSGPSIPKCLECSTGQYGIGRGAPIALANWFWGQAEQQVVDMFLPVSQAIANATQLAKHGVSYCVIPNFIPNDMDLPTKADDALLAQLPKENYLLFVGHLGQEKGVNVLLQAYAEIESQVPLVLIGRPSIGFSLNLPPNVYLLKSWPHTAVMGAWSRSTVALIPSTDLDACPTVAMEAMSLGRPIIASRIGGLPEIVLDGETGILVTPGDSSALRRAIQELLDDSVRRERMGERAKQRVVEFQAKTVVPRIERVYQDALNAKKRESLVTTTI